MLPDDNGSFDDVRSANSTGMDLVALFVARSLPVLSTFLTSSNDPLSSGNTVWQCLPPEQTLLVYQGLKCISLVKTCIIFCLVGLKQC